jgi:AraC family transcriptional regulator, regulatory protein of adaptative response / methylated-DNA-[protein]-cysteine methyltransferase
MLGSATSENVVMHTDYQRIARAIRYLERHLEQQPGLEDLATELDLSPFHCQRLFQRWAGISPKRFLQYLTVEHAKRRLAESNSLLEASLASGLSGTSRLHDHFVTLEAITPGEFRRRGEGLTIRYGIHDSPFGPMLLAVTERGVCGLYFLGQAALETLLDELAEDWPEARLAADQQASGTIAERLFAGGFNPGQPLHLLVRGSNFQVSVWKALLRIPPGTLCSYRQLAEAIDRPRAVRAVGSAVGANPISWLIPCHRVIRASGALGGYRWGLTRKQALIAWESAQRDESEVLAEAG